jgi:phospholipid N-methyltransferase|tara:strand:+ start:44 stop:463 length:420 start_codon:yes stop_codon:yes gene_type:complete
MGLDKFVMGVIVFLVIIVAGTLIISDINTNYDDVNIDIDEYIGNITEEANSNAIYNTSGNMNEQLFENDIEGTDTADSMFKGGFSAITLISSPVRITNKIIQSIGNALGINKIILQYAFSAIIVMVIFWVIFLIFRVKA